jgi:hypothetical protein
VEKERKTYEVQKWEVGQTILEDDTMYQRNLSHAENGNDA